MAVMVGEREREGAVEGCTAVMVGEREGGSSGGVYGRDGGEREGGSSGGVYGRDGGGEGAKKREGERGEREGKRNVWEGSEGM